MSQKKSSNAIRPSRLYNNAPTAKSGIYFHCFCKNNARIKTGNTTKPSLRTSGRNERRAMAPKYFFSENNHTDKTNTNANDGSVNAETETSITMGIARKNKADNPAYSLFNLTEIR